ncbi:MAG TPA: alpha/beta fold hydrolase [Anaerolineae bacterium]|nr:alpha/beta fold hydrolase [Anaerolineae bacterium]
MTTGSTAGEAFYFGAPDSPLFGYYHAPAAGPRALGLVLCHPMGHEYVRAHRAMGQLAIRLARAGFPALRFDYTGCGDSAGSDELGDIHRWQADITAAIDALRKHSGARSIGLIGLRLGAALAATVAAQRADIATVVLWEPIVEGQAYLHELRELHQDKLWHFLGKAQQAAPRDHPTELMGFPLPATLCSQIEAMDLLALVQKPLGHVFIVQREEQPSVARFSEHLTQLGARVQLQQMDSPMIWTEDPDKGLVPHHTLQAIIKWLSEVST